MKLIVENPETNEKREVDVVGLETAQFKDLETLHYPTEENPEQAVKRKLENLDISADQKMQLWEKIKVYAQAVFRVGKQLISIGRKIFDSVLYIIRTYPNTAAGLAVGAVLSALIGAIPIIGWLLNGLASVILPLIGGILGYRSDRSVKGYKKQFLDATSNSAMKETIEKEIQNYDSLNKHF